MPPYRDVLETKAMVPRLGKLRGGSLRRRSAVFSHLPCRFGSETHVNHLYYLATISSRAGHRIARRLPVWIRTPKDTPVNSNVLDNDCAEPCAKTHDSSITDPDLHKIIAAWPKTLSCLPEGNPGNRWDLIGQVASGKGNQVLATLLRHAVAFNQRLGNGTDHFGQCQVFLPLPGVWVSTPTSKVS